MASSLLRYVAIYMLITLTRTFSACAIANRYKMSQADLNPAFSKPLKNCKTFLQKESIPKRNV